MSRSISGFSSILSLKTARRVGFKNYVESIKLKNTCKICALRLGGQKGGILPLRGHSNVQGIGSMGVVQSVKEIVLEKMERNWTLASQNHEGWIHCP